jgi:hypothetical protein
LRERFRFVVAKAGAILSPPRNSGGMRKMSQVVANESPLLTTPEAARFLRVSRNRLGLWRKRDKGPPWIRCLGKVLYDKNKLLEWLAENEHK